MDDTRALLRALADRLAASLEPAMPVSTPIDPVMERALIAFAEGRISPAVIGSTASTPAGEQLIALAARVRTLVVSARAVSAEGPSLGDETRLSIERVSEGIVRQRHGLDKGTEQLRSLSHRLGDVVTSAREVGEVAERASLLALNTGIEAIRVSGESSRALANLGDELRKLCQRAGEEARKIAATLTALAEQSRAIEAQQEESRNAARQISDETSRLATFSESSRKHHAALLSALDGFVVYDDQTEQILARVERSGSLLATELRLAREHLRALDPTDPASEALRCALDRLTHMATDHGEQAE